MMTDCPLFTATQLERPPSLRTDLNFVPDVPSTEKVTV